MSTKGPVVVMELPEHLRRAEAEKFLGELQPLLGNDRPSLVLDCSKVQHMDSAGVDMLLHCLEEAMKRDGDLKLAAVSPASAVLLELMRVDRLFEVFETADQAVRSFHALPIDSNQTVEPWYAPEFGVNDLKAAS